ncbi:hypothetical protein ACFQS7_21835 [Dankookia sp. GCM10030260]|uniref:hypothetical protein n=1 Tax=Dankookia sp. GCM10030260 TaxID=3273390 RepID=UPI003608B468
MLLCLSLGACAVPEELNVVAIYDRISGRADANRPVPPGMDLPTPNLASIPPRPERPSPEFRQAVTDALAADRARSRDPLVLRSVAVPGAAGGESSGGAAMPAAPPRRASLASAPAIPWGEAPAQPAPRSLPDGAPAAPARPSAPLPEMPADAPAAPPPELLGPPPLPR